LKTSDTILTTNSIQLLTSKNCPIFKIQFECPIFRRWHTFFRNIIIQIDHHERINSYDTVPLNRRNERILLAVGFLLIVYAAVEAKIVTQKEASRRMRQAAVFALHRAFQPSKPTKPSKPSKPSNRPFFSSKSPTQRGQTVKEAIKKS
jgi:hypothetical protein